MNIEINKKSYDLYFGWDFLEVINELLGFEMMVENQKIPTKTGGLNFLDMGLSQYDPVTVFKAIKAGLSTTKQKPSDGVIKQWITEKITEDIKEYKKLVDELNQAIKKEPMLKALVKLTQ